MNTAAANEDLDSITDAQYEEAQRIAEREGAPGPTACAEEDPVYAIDLARRAREAVPA